MVTMYSKMLIAALIVAPEVMAMVEQNRFTAWKTQQGKVCASFYFPILNVSPNVHHLCSGKLLRASRCTLAPRRSLSAATSLRTISP